MAKPLTKPTFEPDIHVNTPLSPSVTQTTSAAKPVDPVHELPPAQGIHAIPSRGSKEPKSEIAGIAGRVQERYSAAYARLAARSGDAVVNIKENVAGLFRRARWRARFILDEYPLHVIGVVAGTAFVAGVVLRVWRSSHE
jgi:hypothetical protein